MGAVKSRNPVIEKDKMVKKIKDSLNSELVKKLLKEYYQQDYTNEEINEALSNVCINIISNESFVKEKTKPTPTKAVVKTKIVNNHSSFIEAADKWCKKQSAHGLINYNENNNSKIIVRFGTRKMDSFLPPDDKRNVDWENRDYFYEIDFREHNMKMGVALKNRHNGKETKIQQILSTESKVITNSNWEWKWCWRSITVKQTDLTDEETIFNYLDKQFKDVMLKERNFFGK